VLVRDGYFAQYVPTGHLVYVHEGRVFAAPFDVDRLELRGQAVPVVEGIATNEGFGGAQFSIAGNGTLVYLPGGISSRESNAAPLMLFDRAGNSRRLRGQPAAWFDLQFAPDGNRIAATIGGNTAIDIWLLDATKDVLSRLTFGDGPKVDPAFTPDGTRIAYIEGQQAGDIYWQRADGSDTPQRLTTRPSGKAVLSFHPSGRWLAFGEYDTQLNTGIDVMVMPLEGGDVEGWKPGEPTAFVATPAVERDPAFSPDGRWIAYAWDESGRSEVYVRPFPGPGGKWQISTDGGRLPAWSRARPELLYAVATSGGADVMAAAYEVKGAAFIAERPRPHLTNRIAQGAWALHPDGTSIAAVAATAASEQGFVKQDKVVVWLNVLEELRRVAGGR
jgi:serine/threonine-protein kinase